MTDCSCESSPMRHEPGCPVEDRLVDLTAHVGQTPDGALVATETAESQEHGSGDESDCICGRNFATVRALREHMTKARLIAAQEASCTR